MKLAANLSLLFNELPLLLFIAVVWLVLAKPF